MIVSTRGLGLATRRGWVFRDLSFDLGAGSVGALLGPTGSGKTALLLALAGRMRPTAGSATVAGLDLGRDLRRVRRVTGMGLIAGINDLDDQLTAFDHVREQLLLRWGRPSDAAGLLERTGAAEYARARVEDLDVEQRVRVGLAMALVGSPRLIVADEFDHDLDPDQQIRIATLLRDLADERTAVLTACIDPRAAAGADVIVELGRHGEPAARRGAGPASSIEEVHHAIGAAR
jgi:ABC-type multidrug transport system ATPase subunit